MKRVLVPILMLAAGTAAGWFGCLRFAPPAAAPAPVPVTVALAEPAAAPAVAALKDQSPEARKAAAKTGVENFRAILAKERNPVRATGQILSRLDLMDKESIAALAAQIAASSGADWYDSQSATLRSVVFSKLAELDPARALAEAKKAGDMWSRYAASQAVVEQLARTNPAAAEAAILQFPSGYMRRELTASAAETLARTDGPAGAALLQRMKVPASSWAWSQMFTSWATADPAGASSHLQSMPREYVSQFAGSIAGQWARTDSTAAIAWAESLSDPGAKRGAVRAALSGIAQNDPERATALANARPVGERRELMTAIASTLAQSDGPAAVTWASAITDPIERQRCLAAVCNSADFSDSDTAMLALKELPPGTYRNEAMGNIARAMSYTDPEKAREWAATLKPDEQARVLPQILGYFSRSNPDEAARLAAELPPSSTNEWAWREIAENKSLKDPSAAVTWAAGLETEQARIAAINSAIQQWGGHSPEKAAAAIAAVGDANLRSKAAATLAAAWAQSSPKEALAWAGSLAGEDRIAALSAVWNASAQDDPQRAAQSLAENTAAATTDNSRDQLAKSAAGIASAWAGADPGEAARWAATLPDGAIRDQAAGSIASQWAQFDPEAASQWINALPRDSSRDAAVTSLVSHIANTDPESAFTWASSIGGEEKRIEALKSAASTWKELNPDAARAAVQNATMSEAERTRVMEALK